MTDNRRIFLNIAATYGRSLYALVIGLFCGRWALMALGEVDYGLMGVVGGLVAFISFLNSELAAGTGRFYAFAVGEAKARSDAAAGLENCRRWFSLAVLIHTVFPLALVAVGYPTGVWVVRNFLTIPPDRVEDCVWVFRFVCASCFIGMAAVPYNAMYAAKQYIAELTVYSFVTTTLNVLFLYYIVNHEGRWLVPYCLWSCLLTAAPVVIVALRAHRIFPECRFLPRSCWDFARFRQLAAFVGWNAIGGLAWLLKGQGIAVLVNRYFGPAANAALQIADTVNGHSSSLASSMIGAFQPAIVTACGAGDWDGMRRMAYRTCRYALLMMLVFFLPLALELPEVLRLWLKNPPAYATGLCWLMMAMLLCNNCAVGHMIAVKACGKVARYQCVAGGMVLLTVPLAILFVELGWGIYSVGVAMVLAMGLCSFCRVWLARGLTGMRVRVWLTTVLLPCFALTLGCGAVGYLPHLFWPASLWRVVATTIACELAFVPSVWFLVLDAGERAVLREKILKKVFRR